MTEPRLPLVAPDVAERLRASDAAALARVALAVCDMAAERRPVDDVRYADARRALAEGQNGLAARRDALRELVDELDEVQWSVQAEMGDGSASEDDYARAFETARSANALWCAFDEDRLTAAFEAAYEAHAAIDEDDELLRERVAEALGDD